MKPSFDAQRLDPTKRPRTSVEVQKRNLKPGDLVLFFAEDGEEDGYLCSDGVGEDRVVIKAAKEKETVFKITPMRQYKEGGARRNANAETVEARETRIRKELDTTIDQFWSRNIVYGQIIQLFHYRTRKYLSVAEQTLGDLRLMLDKEGSRRCWFKISPADMNVKNATRKDGEPVLIGDKIKLESVTFGVTLQQALFPSEGIRGDEIYEVELKPLKFTTFSINLYDQPEALVNALRHNMPIRLFHTVTGYMYAKMKLFNYLQTLNRFDSVIRCKSDVNTLVTHCYSSIWVIEDVVKKVKVDNSTLESEILWGKPFRLRFFGTKLYLSLYSLKPTKDVVTEEATDLQQSVDKKDDANPAKPTENFALKLTDAKEDPFTLFTFVNAKDKVNQTENKENYSAEVTVGSVARIQSVNGKYWLHTNPESPIGITESFEVNATRRFFSKDAFLVEEIPAQQLTEYEVIAHMKQYMEDYVAAMKEEVIPESRHQTLMHYLDKIEELIAPDTSNREKDASSAEGEEVKLSLLREYATLIIRQKLLADQGIMDLLGLMSRIEQSKQPITIARKSIYLMGLISKGHPKLALHLLQTLNLNFFMERSDNWANHLIQLPIAEAFENAFENQELLFNVRHQFIKDVFKMATATKDPQYLQLLRKICKYKDMNVIRNQIYIGQELVNHKEIVIKRRLQGGKYELLVKDQWLPVTEAAPKSDPRMTAHPEMLFFKEVLMLFGALCEGRNYFCIEMITEAFDFAEEEVIFSVVKQEHLPSIFRQAYAYCYETMYLDVYPRFESYSELRKIWVVNSEDDVCTVSAPKLSALGKLNDKPAVHEDLMPFPTFIVNYFATFDLQNILHRELPGKLKFALQMMRMARKCYSFGLLQDQEDFLMPIFQTILATNCHFGKARSDRFFDWLANMIYLGNSRDYIELPEDMEKTLMELKMEIIKLIPRFLNLNANLIFHNFFLDFKATAGLTASQLKHEVAYELSRQFQPEMLPQTDKYEFAQALIRLLSTENTKVIGSAFKIVNHVIRSGCQHAVLLHNIQKMQFLVTPEEIDAFENITRLIKQIEVLTPQFDQRLADTINQVNLLYSEYDEKYTLQTLSRNTKLFAAIHKLFSRSIALMCIDPTSELIHNILSATCVFLRKFCKYNKKNQRLMFENFDNLLMGISVLKGNATMLSKLVGVAAEIFRGNITLSEQISESHVEALVKKMFSASNWRPFMDLFFILTKPDVKMLKRTQLLLHNFLLKQDETKEILLKLNIYVNKRPELNPEIMKENIYSDPTQPKEKKKNKNKEKNQVREAEDNMPLLAPEDQEKADGIILLLAFCAQGRAAAIETINQRLIPLGFAVEYCVRMIRKNKSFEPWLLFIAESYFNTESTTHPAVFSVQYSSNFWFILEHIFNMLKHPITTSAELRSFASLFVKQYLNRHFVMQKASPQQRLLAQALLEIAQTTPPPQKHDLMKESPSRTIRESNVKRDSFERPLDKRVSSRRIITSFFKNIFVRSPRKVEIEEKQVDTSIWIELKDSVLLKSIEIMKQLGTIDILPIIIDEIQDPTSSDLRLKVHCMKIIQGFIRDGGLKVKDQLSTLAAPLAIASVLDSDYINLVDIALQTLLMLLEDGKSEYPRANEKAKENIVGALTSGVEGTKLLFDLGRLLVYARDAIKSYRRMVANQRDNGGQWQNTHSTLAWASIGASMDPGEKMSEPDNNIIEDPNLVILKKGQMVYNVCRILQILSQDSPPVKNEISDPSVMLIKESVQFLKLFETIIGEANIELAVQIFKTLTEFVKDSPVGQLAMMNSAIIKPVNNILNNPCIESNNTIDYKAKMIELKLSVIEFLLASSDRADKLVINRIIQLLDFDAFVKMTSLLKNKSSKSVPKSNNLATLAFKLIQQLNSYAENHRLQNKELADSYTACEQNSKNKLASVEVLHNKALHKIYFQIPPSLFKPFLSKKNKEKTIKQKEKSLLKKLDDYMVSQDVDWAKTPVRHKAFIKWIHERLLIEERKLKFYGNIVSLFYKIAWNISFILAFVLNVMLLIQSEIFDSDQLNYSVTILTICALAFSLVVLITFFMKYGVFLNRKEWTKKFPKNKNYLFVKWDTITEKKLHVSKFRYGIQSVGFWLKDGRVWYHILYAASGILGVAVSPYFVGFQLTQLLFRSKHLVFVFKAFKSSVSSWAITLLLAVFGVYLLSILSYYVFQEQYSTEQGIPCETVLQCTLTNLWAGVISGGSLIYTLLPPTLDAMKYAWIVFLFVFYIMIALVMTNTLLAVLVDHFAEMRSKYKDAKTEMRESCFICTLKREVFQDKGREFVKHLETEHNRLHYLYFVMYLKDRITNGEMNQLSQLEREIYKKMKNPNSVLTVFPLGRSLELEKDKDKEENQENVMSELLNRLVMLERHNQQVHQRLDQLTNMLMEDTEQQIEKKLNESTMDM